MPARSLRRTMNALLVTVSFAACQAETSAPRPVPVYGRYALKTVSGDPLPAIISESANFKLEFIRGMITLNEDGSFSDSTDIRRTERQLIRRFIDVAEGTFTQIGDSIALRSTRGENYSVTFTDHDRALTQNLAGSILVYRK